MNIFTIGFTQRTAQQFFDVITKSKIELLIDVRLNNTSQLAGFAKGRDLAYFLHKICHCAYRHDTRLSPTKEILNDYKKGKITWEQYEAQFIPLIEKRKILRNFSQDHSKYKKVCLLCSEAEPLHCHRRILAELLMKQNPNWTITHL